MKEFIKEIVTGWSGLFLFFFILVVGERIMSRISRVKDEKRNTEYRITQLERKLAEKDQEK